MKIKISIQERNGLQRFDQPASVSIPFKKGDLFECSNLSLLDHYEKRLPCQFLVLSSWDDGSVKWLKIHFTVDMPANSELEYFLLLGHKQHTNSKVDGIQAKKITSIIQPNAIIFNTGISEFTINTQANDNFGFSHNCLGDTPSDNVYLTLVSCECIEYKAVIQTVEHQACDDTLTHSIIINGHFSGFKGNKLNFNAKFTFFANTSFVKLDVTCHNPNAALHPGGTWDLGDPNSLCFKSMALCLPTEKDAKVSIEDLCSDYQSSFDGNTKLIQHSSGGVNWNSPIHKNADGFVDIDVNGFEIFSSSSKFSGLRISPSFTVNETEHNLCVFIENFWQNFPKAISKNDDLLQIEIFPEGKFELQPGERKNHSIWVDFSAEKQNFNWVAYPLNITIDSQYIESTAAFELLAVPSQNDEIIQLINIGIEGEHNFFNKREVVDEFGWRNFGDLYADHETERHTGKDIFVSHYNNQYDPIFGLIYQYQISGQNTWFELADDLANHVIDIDIYHTFDDKDEYNGGLFWHTDHYLDASTCTHRTFSKNHQAAYDGYTSGGGPGGQHCYTTGLKYHYFLTGNQKTKKAVLQLADWITFSFEGSNSLLAKLFAIKQSGNHGVKNHILEQYPMDRGTGHYVIALLDAYDITQNVTYLDRGFKIIQNTFHPSDDILLRNFTNIEATWFYTVFLQAVGRFLLIKEQMGQLDDDFYYARDAMLHYADWMLENERPYLEQVEKLEFPNATWVGQDLRKVGIFYMANYYSPQENQCFIDKAKYFYQHIVNTLQNDKNTHYTRILALLMQNIGFVNFFKNSTRQNTFKGRESHDKPVQNNKWLRIIGLLFKELSRLSLKRELKWLSLRSAKVAKLVGNKV